MPKLVIPNAAQLSLLWTHGPAVAYNVYGAAIVGTPLFGQALADTLSTAIRSALSASPMLSQLASTTALQGVTIRDLRVPNLPAFAGAGAAVPGTGVTDRLPGNVALCITLKTAKAGKSFTGRTYLGGFCEATNLSGGVADPTLATNAVAFITAIGNALTASGMALAVLSRPAERVQTVVTTFHVDGTTSVDTHTQEARSGAATQVVSITARNAFWDSQRRRTSAGSSSTLLAPIASSVLIPT